MTALAKTVASDNKSLKASVESQIAQINARLSEMASSMKGASVAGTAPSSTPSADAIFPQLVPQIRDLINNVIIEKLEAQGASMQKLAKENERLKQQVHDLEATAKEQESRLKQDITAAIQAQVSEQLRNFQVRLSVW
jgi:lambda repressor-like predicted transcriptional regulator